ncbi:hypothetical protein Huta_0105 [Halorhabdus utahensis DSM 12940]|uniref:Uncharacterized protein n=2 Tax=Halorhabdus utahensis TaxID=146826 RepID=C7NP03_HALUD|nr:hypothetical protein Huta_0105 [Halorhabdus utahensis DSM 12940]
MPLTDDSKNPAIRDRFGLDNPRAKELLRPPDEAVEAIRSGSRGFVLYAGRPEHGTEELVFTDHDDVGLWPPNETPRTLLVRSGSGTGYHQTYRNSGSVDNAHGKGELAGAGEIRAKNWYVVAPGSIHPSGGIYHQVQNPGIGTIREEHIPPELRPSNGASKGSSHGDPKPLEPDDIEDLGKDFDPDAVTNEWGATVQEARIVSKKLDHLLSTYNPGGSYPSTSEADMATVSMLLVWGFSEVDIADIMRACRPRVKLRDRDDYLTNTITNTALTRINPVDPDLGRIWIESAKENGGRPVFHEATLITLQNSMELLGGEATVSTIVNEGLIQWRGSKERSVMKRVRRALKCLERAGYVTSVDRGATIWYDDGFLDLDLPHNTRL